MSYKVKGNKVKFACPNPKCGTKLITKLSQAGQIDTCPECRCKFRCAGWAERQEQLSRKEERSSFLDAAFDTFSGLLACLIVGIVSLLAVAVIVAPFALLSMAFDGSYSGYSSGSSSSSSSTDWWAGDFSKSSEYQNASPEVQEDMVIYSILRQNGYSNSEATSGTISTIGR